MTGVVIELDHVVKRRGPGFALRDVCLRVDAGELVVLVGASGSGKSTLLSLVNRSHVADAGRVIVDGIDLATVDPVALRGRVGTVFQHFALLPHMTVAENVGLVPRLCGWSRAAIADTVVRQLELVELPASFAERFPSELSGGQQQRVGIARALAARPHVVVLDEPFAALDPRTRESLAQTYRRLHDDLGLATIMVTHDMTEALLLGDRVAVMRDGAIIQDATPGELARAPVDDAVAQMLSAPRRQLRRLAASLGDDDARPR